MLHGQVQVADQFGHFGIDINKPLGEFAWVAGGIADALNARDFGHIFKQGGKVDGFIFCVCIRFACAHCAAVGIDVLTQQIDFFHALVGKAGNFNQHIFKRAAEFFATGVGHNAVAAILAAPFHDGYKGRRAIDLRRWQVVEFFNFRETDIDLWALLHLVLLK